MPTREEILEQAAARALQKSIDESNKAAEKAEQLKRGDAGFKQDRANRLRLAERPRSPVYERPPRTTPGGPGAMDKLRSYTQYGPNRRMEGDLTKRPAVRTLELPTNQGPQAVRKPWLRPGPATAPEFNAPRGRYPLPIEQYTQMRGGTSMPPARGVRPPPPRSYFGRIVDAARNTPRTPILGPGLFGVSLATESPEANAPLVDPVNNPNDYLRMAELGIDPDQYIQDMIASGDYFVDPSMLSEAVANVGQMDPAVYDPELAQQQYDERLMADEATLMGMETPEDIAPYLTQLAQQYYGGMQDRPLMEEEFYPSLLPQGEGIPNEFDLITSLMPDLLTDEERAAMAQQQQDEAMAAAQNFDPNAPNTFLGIDLDAGFNTPEEMYDRLGTTIGHLFSSGAGMPINEDASINYAARPDLQEHMDRYAEFTGRDQLEPMPPGFIPEEDRLDVDQLTADIMEQYWNQQAQPQQQFASANDMAANYRPAMTQENLNTVLGQIAQDRMRNAALRGESPLRDYVNNVPVEGIDFEMRGGVPTFSGAGTVTESAFYGDDTPESEYSGRQTMEDVRLRDAYTQRAFDDLSAARGVLTDQDRAINSMQAQARAAEYAAAEAQQEADQYARLLRTSRAADNPQYAANLAASLEAKQNEANEYRSLARQYGSAALEGTFAAPQPSMTDARIAEMEAQQAAQRQAENDFYQRQWLAAQQNEARQALTQAQKEDSLMDTFPIEGLGREQSLRNSGLQNVVRSLGQFYDFPQAMLVAQMLSQYNTDDPDDLEMFDQAYDDILALVNSRDKQRLDTYITTLFGGA